MACVQAVFNISGSNPADGYTLLQMLSVTRAQTSVASNLTNLALNRPTYSTSLASGLYESRRAVDGNEVAQSSSAPYCFMGYSADPWWWVPTNRSLMHSLIMPLMLLMPC